MPRCELSCLRSKRDLLPVDEALWIGCVVCMRVRVRVALRCGQAAIKICVNQFLWLLKQEVIEGSCDTLASTPSNMAAASM